MVRGATLGARVRYLRERKALTQAELAQAAGVKRWETISAIERGRQKPRPSTLRKIAAALDVEPAALLPDDLGESA